MTWNQEYCACKVNVIEDVAICSHCISCRSVHHLWRLHSHHPHRRHPLHPERMQGLLWQIVTTKYESTVLSLTQLQQQQGELDILVTPFFLVEC